MEDKKDNTSKESDISYQTGKTICKWCGHTLKNGFSHCPTCNKNQNGLRESFSKPSNLIGISATLITFGQLMVTLQQSNVASDFADQAQNSVNKIIQIQDKITELEDTIRRALVKAEGASQDATSAYLKIKIIESRIGDNIEIKNAKEDLDKAKVIYDAKVNLLNSTPKTFSTSIPKVRMEKKVIANLLGKKIYTAVPITTTETVKILNPIYKKYESDIGIQTEKIKSIEKRIYELLNQNQQDK